MLDLILKGSSFSFNGENDLQCHGTAMGTRIAVAFGSLIMAEIETKMLNQSRNKPRVWKRYIDDVPGGAGALPSDGPLGMCRWME